MHIYATYFQFVHRQLKGFQILNVWFSVNQKIFKNPLKLYAVLSVGQTNGTVNSKQFEVEERVRINCKIVEFVVCTHDNIILNTISNRKIIKSSFQQMTILHENIFKL